MLNTIWTLCKVIWEDNELQYQPFWLQLLAYIHYNTLKPICIGYYYCRRSVLLAMYIYFLIATNSRVAAWLTDGGLILNLVTLDSQ